MVRAADESSDEYDSDSDSDRFEYDEQTDDTDEMPSYQLMYLRRSDGETEVYNSARRLEPNRPTDEQLDPTPDAAGNCDYYREVSPDDMKSMQWRRKLGEWLADKAGLDSSHNYLLADFPENYRLYEHVKVNKKGDSEAPKAKTHAGGGNDRQDAYLYGHPLGRKKRFRSPADFAWHLHWLTISPEGPLDPDDCSCKACCPEEFEDPSATKQANKKKERKQATPASNPAGEAAGISQDPSAATRPITGGPGNESNVAQRQQATAAVARARNNATTPVKPTDEDLDKAYGVFMFRQGELVWFHRGVAWGLGLIIARFKNGPVSHYKVQSLSWPGHSSPAVELADDNNLRPWLAWSVPPYTHASLNTTNAVLDYHSFDFGGLAAGRYGPGSIEVDASILAAKRLDATYTTFAQESRTEPEPGVVEKRWRGVYLGAEKIWVDDPVRLYSATGNDTARVLVVRRIVERTNKSAFNNQSWGATLSFIGDTFVLKDTEVQRDRSEHPSLPSLVSPGTPSRMKEDIHRRNILTFQSNRDPWPAKYWKPEEVGVTLDLKDIKGRWYESSLLGPLLLPGQRTEYEEKVLSDEVRDVVSMMNGRGDCNTDNGKRLLSDMRTAARVQAFGKAVPQNTVITESVRPLQQPGPSYPGNIQSQTNVAVPGGAYQGGVTSNSYAQAGVPNPYVQGNVTNPHSQGNVPGSNGTYHSESTPVNSYASHPQAQSNTQQHAIPHSAATGNNNTNFEEFMDLDFEHSSYL